MVHRPASPGSPTPDLLHQNLLLTNSPSDFMHIDCRAALGLQQCLKWLDLICSNRNKYLEQENVDFPRVHGKEHVLRSHLSVISI